MYCLDNVHKSYGATHVLAAINCQIPTDEFVFILGPSGSGKSTLLRLLSFVELPDNGSIHLKLGDRQFDSARTPRPWPKVTAVFQRRFLWPHLTLRNNLSLPLRAAGENEALERIAKVVDLFGMQSFIDRFPNEVSGGQAQRAAIARALVLNPELILIDEAHEGLDLAQQKILNDHLIALRMAGVGLIVVTHSVQFARKHADTIIVIENGMISEIGPAILLDRPKSSFLRGALEL